MYIPQGYIQYKPDLGDYPVGMFTCYVTKDDSDPRAVFFTGKQSKPTFHYRFKNLSDMKERIDQTISKLMSWEDKKASRKIERYQESSLNLGDILYTSWGYDQTNVDFYQVTKVIGRRMVEIRPIGQTFDHGTHGSDYVSAVKDKFIGEAKTHVVKYGNRITIASYASAYLWDGQPKYQTALGYGH